MQEQPSQYYGRHLSKAGREIAKILTEKQRPIITPYELFLEYRQLFYQGKKLYFRTDQPEVDAYDRLRRGLTRAKVLIPDPDYKYRAYRVTAIGDEPADEICCLADPFNYISHLSAMQRYGITNRRPKALNLCRPDRANSRALVRQKMLSDYGGELPENKNQRIILTTINHPKRVRGRSVSVIETSKFGKSIGIRGSNSRIATIGQTFLDMLTHPKLCGGMLHIIEVWQEHAGSYSSEIIEAVEDSQSKIAKVRAGYLLDELMNYRDERIENWVKFAERGSSRILDPEKPFSATHSEKWMLSLNA